jgi:methyl coenzyme M reductase subunit D
MKELRNTLEEYGDVIQLNDEGLKIRIDLNKVINDMELDEEEVDELMERCDESSSCVFDEMWNESLIDKPRFRKDDRWQPNIDDEDFNSHLNDRLSEIN